MIHQIKKFITAFLKNKIYAHILNLLAKKKKQKINNSPITAFAESSTTLAAHDIRKY